MINSANAKSIDVDEFGLRLRSILLKKDESAILISNLIDSDQASDIHNINCDGYGRIWHKSILPEENWGEIVLPYYPAAWKLGISREEASTIQVFQSAGCNYRCWFCFVDYRLLVADIKKAKYFTCDSLVSSLKKEAFIPKVIRLSGGQPDLTPEWTPWMMKALINANLHETTYLWLDDNLSNDYAWRVLRDEDWDLMRSYKNFGRVGCLKGFDPSSFHFNTKAPPEHFYRQLEILKRLLETRLDLYLYLVLTSNNISALAEKMERLLDSLQEIHLNLPLRVSPLKIKPYSPTVYRMKSSEEFAMENNQYCALTAWREALRKRFSPQELRLPCYEVKIH